MSVDVNVEWLRWLKYGALIVAAMQVCGSAHALELIPAKPIRLIGEEIEVVLDSSKRQVRVDRFVVDKELPTGKLQHKLPRPYIFRWSAPTIKGDGVTNFVVSDLFDGVGLKLEIRLSVFKSGRSQATVNLTSQHEETKLFYSAQQLEVKQD